ncbi:uncharacterized protein LOC143298522 [Babylonia areolata]|uniref:uncharacterized protein LOC143298522 n=1 Tax=Babylonia areolata TaxID=304850 RepID=UPI003FD183C8
MAAAKKEKEYRLLIVGKSGSGKSSTANSIMGGKCFPVAMGLKACTTECTVKLSPRNEKGITFRIADTPGLFDPTKTNGEIGNEIIKASASMYPGLHAILYVLQPVRYTPEERDTFYKLKELFDPNVTKHVIIIFTKGDEMEKNNITLQSLVEEADGPFKEVLEECGKRVLVFDNTKRDQKQIDDLLEMVDKMWKENGEVPYTCEVQNVVNEKLEKWVTIRTKEKIMKDPKLKKLFDVMEEENREAEAEADDLRKRLEETKSKKEQTEAMIEKTLKEIEELKRKEKEREEREKREKAERERKDLEDKRKIKEEEERKAEERARRREEEERKAEERARRREEEERKAEEEKARRREEFERKAEEERARRQKEEELKELKKEHERLRFEQEIKRIQKEEKRKLQEANAKKMEEERLKLQKKEMEKAKQDIVEDRETGWMEDVGAGLVNVAGGAWKFAKGWFGF